MEFFETRGQDYISHKMALRTVIRMTAGYDFFPWSCSLRRLSLKQLKPLAQANQQLNGRLLAEKGSWAANGPRAQESYPRF